MNAIRTQPGQGRDQTGVPLAMTPEPPLRPMRVLRLPDLEHKVGLKKTQIYGLMAAGQFPAAIKLTVRVSGWLEHEIDDWIQVRAAHRTTRPADADE